MSYFVRRIFFSFFVIVAVAVLTFVIMRLLPGDPLTTWLGDRPTQEQIDKARRELGLDQPLYVQGWKYIGNVARGDFGRSLRTRRPVWDELKEKFAATFELTSLAMFFCLLFGIPVGIAAARHPDSPWARLEKFLSLSGVAIPVFWLGMLLQILLAGKLNWLPLQGRGVLPPPEHSYTGLLLLDALLNLEYDTFADALQHIFMPALALSLASFGIITRSVRSAMGQVLHKEYIRTARAFGVPQKRILFVHALKNALIPVITVSGLVYGYLLGGTFLIERVFDWPGLGQLAVMSILTNDMPVVSGVALLYAFVYTLINLALDLFYLWIDPRITKNAV